MKYIKIILIVVFIILTVFNTYSVLRLNTIQNAQSNIIGYLATPNNEGITGFMIEVAKTINFINSKQK